MATSAFIARGPAPPTPPARTQVLRVGRRQRDVAHLADTVRGEFKESAGEEGEGERRPRREPDAPAQIEGGGAGGAAARHGEDDERRLLLVRRDGGVPCTCIRSD